MRKDSQQKKIISGLAIKYNLSEEKIEEIVESPFIFIRGKITSIELSGNETEEEFEEKMYNFNIPRIGKLYANYKTFKFLNNVRRKNTD